MLNKLIISTFTLFAGLFITACNQSNQQSRSAENKEEVQEKTQVTKLEGEICYKNVFPYRDNPMMKDIQELNLVIDGDQVSGEYNWLPAEKDQRKGSLTGTIEDNIIIAEYQFMQEGNEETASITIDIDHQKAVIVGGNPELGLNATIKKIDCE
ncbi:hypothetical protein [Chondrinema litorale]|uniref:hypothetical protein n=1 Tax=Chondrinema litorale TaxID=2994555 RepID=UPI002542FAE2|nr:hypothetical protein [Chondrinema litorale]UZR97192.1 hypothetical protein OQ292_25165 [Chondrinema litorale]